MYTVVTKKKKKKKKRACTFHLLNIHKTKLRADCKPDKYIFSNELQM